MVAHDSQNALFPFFKRYTPDFIYLKAVITNISLKLLVQITTIQRVLDIHFLKSQDFKKKTRLMTYQVDEASHGIFMGTDALTWVKAALCHFKPGCFHL